MNPKVFKKAQSRWWMKGWEFEREDEHYYMGTLYVFKQVEKEKWLSLNDILFSTDFCEKYFDAFCKYPCCKEALYYGEPKQHQQAMLPMSEPERIEFLEQHLEIKDELCEKTEHFNKEGVDIVLKPCNKNGCMVLHTEKNDTRKIEGISEVHIDRINGVDHFSIQTRKDIIVTINQLVKVANAQQKELDNLKLNQGGH